MYASPRIVGVPNPDGTQDPLALAVFDWDPIEHPRDLLGRFKETVVEGIHFTDPDSAAAIQREGSFRVNADASIAELGHGSYFVTGPVDDAETYAYGDAQVPVKIDVKNPFVAEYHPFGEGPWEKEILGPANEKAGLDENDFSNEAMQKRAAAVTEVLREKGYDSVLLNEMLDGEGFQDGKNVVVMVLDPAEAVEVQPIAPKPVMTSTEAKAWAAQYEKDLSFDQLEPDSEYQMYEMPLPTKLSDERIGEVVSALDYVRMHDPETWDTFGGLRTTGASAMDDEFAADAIARGSVMATSLSENGQWEIMVNDLNYGEQINDGIIETLPHANTFHTGIGGVAVHEFGHVWHGEHRDATERAQEALDKYGKEWVAAHLSSRASVSSEELIAELYAADLTDADIPDELQGILSPPPEGDETSDIPYLGDTPLRSTVADAMGELLPGDKFTFGVDDHDMMITRVGSSVGLWLWDDDEGWELDETRTGYRGILDYLEHEEQAIRPDEPADVMSKETEDGKVVAAPKQDYIERTHTWYHENGVKPNPQEAQRLQSQLDEMDVAIRLFPDSLMKVIEDGRFKNLHESGRTTGMYDPEGRSQLEMQIWGAHPIYGYMGGVDDDRHIGSDEALSYYGNVKVKLKPEVRDRTTITPEDSLMASHPLPSPLDDVDPYTVGDWEEWNRQIAERAGREYKPWEREPRDYTDTDSGYVEAQIFGDITLSDVEEVVFGSVRPGPALIAAMEAAELPWRQSEEAYGKYQDQDWRGPSDEMDRMEEWGWDARKAMEEGLWVW